MKLPRDTISDFERLLRRFQRSGPAQFSIEIESIGGRAPTPTFRIVNQGNHQILPTPATGDHDTLYAALAEATKWSRTNGSH